MALWGHMLMCAMSTRRCDVKHFPAEGGVLEHIARPLCVRARTMR